MVIPSAATSPPAATSRASLVHGGSCRMSSTAMVTVIASVTASTCQRLGIEFPKTSSAMAKPANMAMPPRRGMRRPCMRRSSPGSSSAPTWRASAMVRGMTSMHTALASRNGGTAGSQAASASIRGLTANSGAPVRQREAAAEVEAALADLGADAGTVELVEHEEDQVGDLAHLDLPHSP